MEPDYLSLLDEVRGTTPSVSSATELPGAPTPPITAPVGGVDYLSLLAEVRNTAAKAPNPDKVFQAMKNAEGKNPDEEARRAELAKQLGTQPILLPPTKEAEAMLQRKQNDPTDITQQSPATAKWLEQNAHLASIADGDVNKLRKLEYTFYSLDYLGKSIKAGGHSALAAIAKLAKAALPDMGISEEGAAMLSKGNPVEFERLRSSDWLGGFAREQHAKSEATMRDLSPFQKKEYGSLEYFTTDPEKAAYLNPVKIVSDVFQSLPSSAMIGLTFMLTKGASMSARLKALAEGATPEAATRAAVAAATKMATVVGGISEGAITYGQNSLATAAEVERLTLAQIASSPDYQAYLQLGYDPQVARTLLASKTGELSGSVSAITTGAIAGIGGRYLGKIVGEGGAFFPRIGKGAVLGSTEEALQSPLEKIAENVAIKLKADETQSVMEGTGEALVQGAVVGGVTSGAMSGFVGNNQQATQAQTDHTALSTLADQAAENPIRDRSPDAFKDFVNAMTEGGQLEEVFVDTGKLSEVFAQSGISMDKLEQVMPDVAAQLNDDTNSDGYVRIPTADLVAKIHNPEMLKSILDNAKTNPDGMTFLDSETFFQKHHENFTKEAEIEASAKTVRDQHEKDLKEIRQQITDVLVATDRYDPKVAAANAVPISAFYATQAARFEGVTAKQLFEQHPYRAQRGEEGQGLGGETFAQTDAFKSWFEGSKVVDEEGKPLRVFHGTQGDFDTFEVGRPTKNSTIFGSYDAKRTGVFFAEKKEFSDEFAGTGKDKKILETYLYIADPADLTNVYTLRDAFLNTLDANGYNSRMLTNGNLETWELFDEENGGKEFVAALKKMGYDGAVITENDENREPQKVWVAFEPTQIKSAIGNEGTFDPNNPNILKQDNNAEFSPADLMSTFYEGANLSSIIHEAGHFYLEVLERLASRPDAPQGIVDDYNKIMNWFGVTPEQWAGMSIAERTPMHEQFAESQELWMLEGKSPTLEMQPIFSRFRRWMLDVYQSAKDFIRLHPAAGKLNDEVRAVFDRLIASEEAIRETEAARGYVPLFQTAEQAGLSEEKFKAYIAEHEKATDGAVENLQKRSMRDVKWLNNARSRVLKGIQAKAKEARDAIREEVSVEVMSEPINQVRHFLRTGETVDALTGQTTTADKFKLNTEAVKDIATDGKVPPNMKNMVAPDGLHPDAVASMFDFQSGDALFWKLMLAENAQEKIDGITDQRMLERHGEMVDARAIEEAANAAVHNEARTRFLATGLRILTKSNIPVSQLTKAAKLAAEEAIAKIRVKDLRPNQYAAAERKANKDALKFAVKDPAAAIRAQRAALLNNQLYKVAVDVQEEINSDLARMKRITKPAAQKAMGGEHLLQLNALLDRFGVSSKQSLTAMDKRLDLKDYLRAESARLSAIAPNVPDWIASEQVSQDYQTLSLMEFRELMDAVKSIELLARRERYQYMAIRQQTFQEEKASILGRLREFHPELFTLDGSPKPLKPKLVPKLGEGFGSDIGALLMNAETIVNIMEGGEFGTLHESLLGRMSERTDWKSTRMEEVYSVVKPLFAQYSTLERRAFSRKDIGTATLGFEMTRENAVVVALLHGNREGRDRLTNYGWNPATQRQIIDLLEPRDVKLANGVWDLFDNSLWPELRALDERTQGKAAPKIEAMPYTTRSGDMRGGYFKLKYDSNISSAPRNGAEAIQQLREGRGYGMVSTPQGSSQAREETVKKPPRLDFGVFFETVNETVHDLAFREAVADTYRLLVDDDIQMAIKGASSPQEYNALVARIGNVAMRERQPDTWFEKALNKARKNTVAVLMSGMYTAFQNYLNFFPLSERVGKVNLVQEILRMHSPMGPAAYRFAVDSSEYLRNRHLSYDRTLQEEARKMTINEPLMPAMSTWLWLLGKVDQVVSAIGWNAAYRSGMEKYQNDHGQSVLYADHVVRQTQGSGRELDISQMQEGPYRQLLTMFFSFANSQLSMQIRAGSIAKREMSEGEKLKAVTRFMKAMAMVVIMPAIMNDLAISFLRGDPGDDDEDWLGRFARDAGLYQLSFIPLLREVGPYFWRSFDSDLASYGFKMSPVQSAVEGVRGGVASAVDIYNDEGDMKDNGNIIMGLSYFLGLPGLMVKNVVVGTGAWLNGEAGPGAILLGPPKERK